MSIASRDTARVVHRLEDRFVAKLGDRTTITEAEMWRLAFECAVEMLVAERAGGLHRTAPTPQRADPKAQPAGIMLVSEETRMRATAAGATTGRA